MSSDDSLQARLVAGLPDLGEGDGGVEAVEDAERQGEALHQGPGDESVEVKLNRVGEDFLGFKGVDEPHGDVADEQEGDGLARRLGALLFGQVHAAPGHVRDEQHLQDHLEYAQSAGDHDEEVRLVSEHAHSAGDDAEDGVDEETEGRHAQQDVVQVRLLLSTELQRLHPVDRISKGGGAPFHIATTYKSD